MRVFVRGKTTVDLEARDFVGQGGEGAVYVKGGTAYKVYADRSHALPPAKIAELAAIRLPHILTPRDLLADARGNPVGYTMAHAGLSFPLCQIFTRAFRERRRIDNHQVFRLVRAIQEGIRHVHDQGILLVDLNETNFLIENGLRTVYFIDVDSYQTPSFPATAIMETIRDRHASQFDENTDWFAFAIVSFQMLIGIHPYKGVHPDLKTMDERMQANVSVFHPDVSLPVTCEPFDAIPEAYRGWYQALFDLGERCPPPASAAAAPRAAMRVRRAEGSRHFEIVAFEEFPAAVWNYAGGLAVTSDGVFREGRLVLPQPVEGDLCLATVPQTGAEVAGWIEEGFARFRNLATGEDMRSAMRADEMAAADERIYVRQQDQLLEVIFLATTAGQVATGKPVSAVLPNATRLYEGLALMNLLGAWYAVLLPAPGKSYQARIPELDGCRVIDARFEGGVLVAVGEKSSRLDRFILRFDDAFGAYDVRVARDVPYAEINFTTLATGVCLHMSHTGELEVFASRKGSEGMKVIADPALGADCRLLKCGAQAMFARGPALYKFSMRRPT